MKKGKLSWFRFSLIFSIVFYSGFLLADEEAPDWNIRGGQSELSTSFFLERSLIGPNTLGLGYGRFYGRLVGSDDFDLVSGFHQYSLQYNRFIWGNRFKDGFVLRLSLTYSELKKGSTISSLETKEGKNIVTAGEGEWGHTFALGYEWYWSHLNFSLQSELVRIGGFETWSPVSIWLGFTF